MAESQPREAKPKRDRLPESADDAVVTLDEYFERLDKRARLEEETKEAYPDPSTECTYEKGYVTQSIYACRTCAAKSGNRGVGVCYSCCIECHTSHDIIELYTRRHFRCDCPCSKAYSCRYHKGAPRPPNRENRYNHNFDNVFCFCSVNYDPECEDGTMFMCIGCEDWYHEECITQQAQHVENSPHKAEIMPDRGLNEQQGVLDVGDSSAPEATRGAHRSHERPAGATGDSRSNLPALEVGPPRSPEGTRRAISLPEDESVWQEFLCSNCITPSLWQLVARNPRMIWVGDDFPKCFPPQPAGARICLHHEAAKMVGAPKTREQMRSALLVEGWEDALCQCWDCRKTIEASPLSFILSDESCIPAPGSERQVQSFSESAANGASTRSALPTSASAAERALNVFANASSVGEAVDQLSQVDRVAATEIAYGIGNLTRSFSEWFQELGHQTGEVITKEQVQTLIEKLRRKEPRLR